ncbi:hypothetical protein Btru_048758 [Bulinus truncatus]|nr:hypothetical protein Btru_048758 [Bulinus truncatus]
MKFLAVLITTSNFIFTCQSLRCAKGMYVNYTPDRHPYCVTCPDNTYIDVDNHSAESCRPCTGYAVESDYVKTTLPCTADRDTVISECISGFYLDTRDLEYGCRPCPQCTDKEVPGCCSVGDESAFVSATPNQTFSTWQTTIGRLLATSSTFDSHSKYGSHSRPDSHSKSDLHSKSDPHSKSDLHSKSDPHSRSDSHSRSCPSHSTLNGKTQVKLMSCDALDEKDCRNEAVSKSNCSRSSDSAPVLCSACPTCQSLLPLRVQSSPSGAATVVWHPAVVITVIAVSMHVCEVPDIMGAEVQSTIVPAIVTKIEAAFDKIVSDYLYNQFETFVAFWLVTLLCIAGLVTNYFNMAVFSEQGFKDGVNISMVTITVWDFVKCLTALVNRLHGPIGLFSAAAATTWRNMTFPATAYTPIFSGYVTFCLTTYVSVERCLCVSRPFTFRSAFTLVAMVVISGTVFGTYAVMLFVYDVVFIYNPAFNATIAVYAYNSFYHQNYQIILPYYRLTGIALPATSFVVLCFSSACTVYYLRKSSQSLSVVQDDSKSSQSSSVVSAISRRERQVVMMLLCVIFTTIANLFPRVLFYVAQLVEPELFLLRKYHNLFSVVAVCLFALDILRASVNFVLFFRMSSQFKQTFRRKFQSKCLDTHQEK